MPYTKPNLNLPDSVNKCKNGYKNLVVDATMPFQLPLYADLNCFVEPWVHGIRIGDRRLVSTSLYSVLQTDQM